MLAIQVFQQETIKCASCKWNVGSVQVNKERKKSYAEVAEIDSQDESYVCYIVKKEEDIHASFTVTPQTAKVRATMCYKYIVKKEKTFNLWVEDKQKTCSK